MNGDRNRRQLQAAALRLVLSARRRQPITVAGVTQGRTLRPAPALRGSNSRAAATSRVGPPPRADLRHIGRGSLDHLAAVRQLSPMYLPGGDTGLSLFRAPTSRRFVR